MPILPIHAATAAAADVRASASGAREGGALQRQALRPALSARTPNPSSRRFIAARVAARGVADG